MDSTQLAQTVNWLDEQRRADKQEIARLQQTVEALVGEAREHARRVQELEGRLANTIAQLTRFTTIEQSVEQAKIELVAMTEASEVRLRSELRESDRARLAERESVGKGMAELRKELGRFAPLEEEMVVRRADDQRLTEATLALRQGLLDIRKEIESRTRSLPFIEEQRAQDAKRITELQAVTADVLKRIETFPPKIGLLEERVRKMEQRVEGLHTVHEEVRKAQARFGEIQELRDQDRKRQMELWQVGLDQQQKSVADYGKQMQRYNEFYEQNRQALAGLEKLQTHLLQRQAETAEIQRVEEERLKKQIEEWKAEYERLFKHQALEIDHSWAEQKQVNVDLAAKFPAIDKALIENQRFAQQLFETQKDWLSRQLGVWQQFQAELDEHSVRRPKSKARE
jgi:hypothetical protein